MDCDGGCCVEEKEEECETEIREGKDRWGAAGVVWVAVRIISFQIPWAREGCPER